jgi:hypothetical protein
MSRIDDKAEFGSHDLLARKQSLATSILKAEMLRFLYFNMGANFRKGPVVAVCE